jgi:hypothetical protein
MSDEAWLIGREMDASKKILLAIRILVFDFELFIGELCQIMSAGNPYVCQPFAQFMTSCSNYR